MERSFHHWGARKERQEEKVPVLLTKVKVRVRVYVTDPCSHWSLLLLQHFSFWWNDLPVLLSRGVVCEY